MTTDLNYLDDTYVDTGNAKAVRVGHDDRGTYMVLDQTLFYPQGGGQPSDVGSIKCGDTSLEVTFVGFNEGEALHYVAETSADLDTLVGQTCALKVDMSQRLIHAKLHTAGHLISSLIDAKRGSMRAVKGFHFSNGPYVEFEGKPAENEDNETIISELQTQIDALIAENPPITTSLVTFEELQQRCWTVPSFLPQDKPLRVVTIGELDAVPCGGTHLSSLAELGSVSILKMKSKKGNTKISYRVGE